MTEGYPKTTYRKRLARRLALVRDGKAADMNKKTEGAD